MRREPVIDASVASRFWAKVLIQANGCWLWNGAKNEHGYGTIHIAGKNFRAHRVAWILTNGPIGDGLVACHKCDVPACVRPDHISLGTQKDNIRDAAAKGRTSRGPSHGAAVLASGRFSRPWKIHRGTSNKNAKLNDAQVREIRNLCASGLRQKDVAIQYGITQALVSWIVRRNGWAHVE